jgi:GNAT superfamily N-acetyltransferase
MSMRYEGEDAQKPFVDATPLSRPLRVPDIPALARAAHDAYGSLRPRYVRLWSSEQQGWVDGSVPDKRFLAAQLESLRRGTATRIPSELGVISARSLENYAQAQRAYEAIRATHPVHSQQAALQSLVDLNETLVSGLLFDVTVEGTWAGYVAATRDGDTLGLPAYIVQELVLASEFRRRGYGRHLTTLLARALPDEESILLGTIHAENRGAIQAATAAGRVDVGGWIQIPLR